MNNSSKTKDNKDNMTNKDNKIKGNKGNKDNKDNKDNKTNKLDYKTLIKVNNIVFILTITSHNISQYLFYL